MAAGYRAARVKIIMADFRCDLGESDIIARASQDLVSSRETLCYDDPTPRKTGEP